MRAGWSGWIKRENTTRRHILATIAGYRRALAARAAVLGAGGHTIAPCPHDRPCPLPADDWCHFAVRLPRSKLHRRAKGVELGYEDEKFSYVVATRDPALTPATETLTTPEAGSAPGRVLRHPVTRKGLVMLEVCHADGSAGREIITKRSPMAYRAARDAGRTRAGPPAGL